MGRGQVEYLREVRHERLVRRVEARPAAQHYRFCARSAVDEHARVLAELVFGEAQDVGRDTAWRIH